MYMLRSKVLLECYKTVAGLHFYDDMDSCAVRPFVGLSVRLSVCLHLALPRRRRFPFIDPLWSSRHCVVVFVSTLR